MKILSRPNGNAEEYGKWSVNPYVGCPHGCKYCYLKKGVWKNTLGGDVPTLKKGLLGDDHAFHVAMAEILENKEQIIKNGGLFMTFTSDPFLRETRSLFMSIASSCAHHGIPVTVLTKCGADCIGRKFDNKYKDAGYRLENDLLRLAYGQIAIGWTLTGYDELEPNASPNSERINAMGVFSDVIRDVKLRESVSSSIDSKMLFGSKIIVDPHIWASIEPVIDFESSYNMILAALDAGCRHFKIGLQTNNTKVCRKMYDHDACIKFIHDVMRVMEAGGGTATVYWKQSFSDFLGEEDFARATVGYKNIVGKDWSMFNH